MLVAIVGGSGSGKSSVAAELVKRYDFKETVSVTTRPIREYEEEGKDYYFVSVDKFLGLIDNKELLEYTKYNENYYGTLKRYVDDTSCNYVAVVTPSGLRSIKNYIGDRKGLLTSVYIKVSERNRVLNSINRGTDLVEVFQRMLTDRGLLEGIENEVDHVIDNSTMGYSIESIAFEICSGQFSF